MTFQAPQVATVNNRLLDQVIEQHLGLSYHEQIMPFFSNMDHLFCEINLEHAHRWRHQALG